jgi:2-polyprenyl-6-methoxyphenol hydroxylase-like FAD-dependent oxidoreductase
VLKEMGVWQRIMERGSFRWINKVGVMGHNASSVTGSLRSHRPMTIQRIILDQELALAAQQAGATLATNHTVESAELIDGCWTVHCAGHARYHCSVLVCADGAQSALARQLGIVTDPTNAIGERVFLGPASGSSLR